MPAQTEPRPFVLRQVVDRLVDGVPLAALRAAAGRLSAAYRAGVSAAAPPLASTHDRLAYLATRLPSTFEATRRVLGELRRAAPDLQVQSLLELGAGPAPGLWAAERHFPDLSRATHVELDAEMADLSRRLLAAGQFSSSIESTWVLQDISRADEFGAHDLVLAGYVLGELPEPARDAFIDAAWAVTAAALVIVEPGTPAGAARVVRARARLVEAGAHVAAPCPHDGACPLASDDWCHFGVRVNRSSMHRRLKGGSLGYEDEKFSYVAVVRGTADPCAARVLRRPRAAPRRVSLRLCAADGLREELVTRSAGARYRAARKTDWGDAWLPHPAETRAGR
jgi:ribosomal protein RSM22 (predicted rRNA methylase)